VLRRGNPYVCLAVAVALVLVAVASDDAGTRITLGVLGVAASAVAVLLFLRQARDPNGPPGQH